MKIDFTNVFIDPSLSSMDLFRPINAFYAYYLGKLLVLGRPMGNYSKRRTARKLLTRQLSRGFETLDARRVLAGITGTVFEDLDQSGVLDNGELGVQERVVYIDSNNNGLVDLGEPLERTQGDGTFEFKDLNPGTYRLRLYEGAPAAQNTTLPDGFPLLVTLADAESTVDVEVGVFDTQPNTEAPASGNPVFTVAEDTRFTNPDPGVFGIVGNTGSASDADGDSFIAIQTSEAAHGTITISPNGTLSYIPLQDYVGEDSATFVLHDGRGVSQSITARVVLTAVADQPTDIVFTGQPVPEHTPGGTQLGGLQVIDPDLGDLFNFVIDDDRVILQNDLLILAPNVQLNFEQNPDLRVFVQAINRADPNEVIEREVVIPLADEDDPTTDLVGPADPQVNENEVGAVIGRVTVVDEDTNQQHNIEVSDPRFEVDGNQLKLRDDVTLNHEDDDNTRIFLRLDELSTEVIISVTDVNEPPQDLILQGSIPELTLNAAVGTIQVVDPDTNDTHTFTVSDDRFFVDDSNALRLKDGQFVDYDTEPSVSILITVADSGTPPETYSEEFAITVIAIPSPWQNPINNNDVDNDGEVTPLDPLQIINMLNELGPSDLNRPKDGTPFVDVNGDGLLTPLDALLVINEINANSLTVPSPDGEAPQQNSGQNQLSSGPSRPLPAFAEAVDSAIDDEEEWLNDHDSLYLGIS